METAITTDSYRAIVKDLREFDVVLSAPSDDMFILSSQIITADTINYDEPSKEKVISEHTLCCIVGNVEALIDAL